MSAIELFVVCTARHCSDVQIVSFPVSAVTIGFNPPTYSVHEEDAGSVIVTLSVPAGNLLD